MKRPCLGCSRLIPTSAGSYCARCAKTSPRQTKGRGSGWDATKFRRAVLARAHGRCERCGSRHKVEAHHKRPLEHGGTNDPGNGEAVCAVCHPVAERAGRP